MGITLDSDSDAAIKFGQDHNSHGILIMALVVSVNDDTRCTPCKHIFCTTILLPFFIEVIQMCVTKLQTPQPIFTCQILVNNQPDALFHVFIYSFHLNKI